MNFITHHLCDRGDRVLETPTDAGRLSSFFPHAGHANTFFSSVSSIITGGQWLLHKAYPNSTANLASPSLNSISAFSMILERPSLFCLEGVMPAISFMRERASLNKLTPAVR